MAVREQFFPDTFIYLRDCKLSPLFHLNILTEFQSVARMYSKTTKKFQFSNRNPVRGFLVLIGLKFPRHYHIFML